MRTLLKPNRPKSVREFRSIGEFYDHVVSELVLPFGFFVDRDLEERDDLWVSDPLSMENVYVPSLPMPVMTLHHSCMRFFERTGLFSYTPVDLESYVAKNNGSIDRLFVRTEKGLRSIEALCGPGASLRPYNRISTVWTTMEVFAYELQCLTEGSGCRVNSRFQPPENYRYSYHGFRRGYISKILEGWDGREPMSQEQAVLVGDEDHIRHLFNYHSSKLVLKEGRLRSALEYFADIAEDCTLTIHLEPRGVVISQGADEKYLPWLREKLNKDDGSGDILKIHDSLE